MTLCNSYHQICISGLSFCMLKSQVPLVALAGATSLLGGLVQVASVDVIRAPPPAALPRPELPAAD
jgi:hypothetical protein